ncbi:hypothetical protein BX661DRAFT_186943 [Kickxella alabastrina]|uniref:uncharacterized protein n=1 Tax=Kickxella alabastrina TaxID=61397 RepID=UPI00221F618A|nr:uncharacterized protein BX661DRAFT_186943 [Kickxella alabastrina]KAI7823146.1 hypothetical protein BX661DRAFT_186943 [Kickxella alabastrina]
MTIRLGSLIDRIDRRVAESPVGRWFCLEGSGAKKERAGSKFSIELRGGLATFSTLSYIISVYSGGPCDCDRTVYGAKCEGDTAYNTCLQLLKMDLITATCALSCISCVLMGGLANLPIALAPGMGLIAYFSYTVVGFHGSGNISYENALAAVKSQDSYGTGIGIYLAFIGLQSSAGIGLITSSASTLVELGGYRTEDNVCLSHHMQGGPTWVGIMGLVIICILTVYKVKGAMLIGIVIVSIISWPRGTAITYFPYTQKGNEAFDYFKKVVTFHPIKMITANFKFDVNSGQFWIALITFLYVDILDCTGTLFSMAKFGGYMDERTQDFEGSGVAFLVDSVCIVLSSVFGLPPVSSFVESGAGIAEGAKTGIASVMTGFCFFIALFFAPIFASFPPWATGPALILVGSMMIQNVVNINWKYVGDSVPAFLTIILIPFAYSIGYGLIAGIGTYIAINGFVWAVAKVSRDRIVPPNRRDREIWTAFILLRIRSGDNNDIADEGAFQDIEMRDQDHCTSVHNTQNKLHCRGSVNVTNGSGSAYELGSGSHTRQETPANSIKESHMKTRAMPVHRQM